MKVILIMWGLFVCPHFILSAEEEEEIWVAVDDKLEVFSGLNHLKTIPVAGARHVISMVEDPSTGRIFLSELGLKGPSVYMVKKDGEQVMLAKDINPDNTTTNFPDLTYDPSDGILYLTSKQQKTIYSLEVEGGATELKKYFSQAGKTPRGIDIDLCSRSIYWTNVGYKYPSFEVLANRNSSQNKRTLDDGFLSSQSHISYTLKSDKLTRPGAVSIDHTERSIYWTQTYRGMATLHKTKMYEGRTEELCSLGAQNPAYLQVTDKYVYWTDWKTHSLQRISKTKECKIETVSTFDSRPYGLTWKRNKPVSCPIVEEENHVLDHTVDSSEVEEIIQHEEKEEEAMPQQCVNFCLSDGICKLDPLGTPLCHCPEGFKGLRCEQNVCSNFCLHDGSSCVLLQGEPQCLCPAGFHGDRCQLIKEEEVKHQENQSDSEAEIQKVLIFGFPLSSSNLQTIIILIFSASLMLILVLSILCFCVFRLKKRPRVKRKRFISIHKGDRMRSQEQNSGITLDIEDCCNMTLCDTPCVEPPTRTPHKQNKGRKCDLKTGDKYSLLDHENEDD